MHTYSSTDYKPASLLNSFLAFLGQEMSPQIPELTMLQAKILLPTTEDGRLQWNQTSYKCLIWLLQIQNQVLAKATQH